VSSILLATNSKTGFFWIFPKEHRKFVTFKTGILGGPVIKVTTKVKLHEGNQIYFPLMQPYPISLKAKTIEFCAVDKNESLSATFWQ